MDKFLDKISLRKLKILQLLESKNDYYSLREILSVISVTKKTAKRTMGVLAEDLKLWPEQIELVYEEERGYRLFLKEDFSINMIRLIYLDNSITYKICKEILNGDFIDITTFALSNYMSYTAIHNKLGEFRKILTEYGLSVTFTPRTEIVGGEKQIRYFSYLFFWNSNYSISWPFHQAVKKELDEIIAEIDMVNRLSLAEKDSLRFWLAVTIVRIKHGKLIGKKLRQRPIFIEEIRIRQLEKQLTIFFTKYAELTSSELQNEIYFLYEVFFSFDYHSQNDDTTSRLMMKMPRYQNLDYVKVALYWLDTYVLCFNKHLGINDYSMLFANLMHLHYRIQLFEIQSQPFALINYEEVNLREGKFLNEVRAFYEKLEEDESFHSIFANREVLFPEYYLLLQNLSEMPHKRSLNIFLYSILGSKNINRLKANVRRCYEGEVVFLKELTQEPDLIITDCFFEEMDWYLCQKFMWNTYPIPSDLDRLENILGNL